MDIYGILGFSIFPLCFLILNIKNISSFFLVAPNHHHQKLQHVNSHRLAGEKGFWEKLMAGGGVAVVRKFPVEGFVSRGQKLRATNDDGDDEEEER